MGTTLFIAEKRDMAISIAKALSPSNDIKKSFIVGKNNTIFTWAIGHLLELDPSEKPSEKWSLETLPIIPKMFNLKPIPNKSSQLQIIKKLATDADVIINASDAGREGELIFYYIAKYLNLTKRPIKRLWTSSQQPQGIQTAYKNLKDWDEFEGLRVAAITRSRSDWIIGINATRAFTAKSGTLLKIGRVATPTLALIYKRHMERETFKKEPYFPITATFKQGDTTYIGKWQGDMIKERRLSEKIKSEILNQNGEIIEMEEKNENEPVPLLFNLTDLTNLANQRFGFKAKQTLKLAQSLYETHKCITYPRTSSRYITENEVPLMLKSHQVLKDQFTQYVKSGMNPSLVHTGNKRICNPAKVDDHHALLPEPVIPSNLSTDEEKIYHLILERFFIQFYPVAQYQSLTIQTNCAGHLFLSKYKNLIEEGWRTITEKEDKHDSNEFPLVDKTRTVTCTEAEIEEKETKPPSLYTDGSLVVAMSNVSNHVEDEKLKIALKDKGIGTVATRPQIISKLEDEKMTQYKGKTLDITEKGKQLIETLQKTKIRTLTSAEYTALWEYRLTMIEKKKYSEKEFMQQIEKFTKMIVEEAKSTDIEMPSSQQENIGNCLVCGSELREGKKQYFCSKKSEGCSFFIWKQQYGKNLTAKMISMLLTKKQTNWLSFKNRKGVTYQARLLLPDPLDNGKLSLDFKNKR